jgi:ferredoxin
MASFSTSKAAFNESAESVDDGPPVSFKFIEQSSGEVIEVTSARGKKMVDVALDNDVDIEAACGGELACSTCHVVLDKKLYDVLPGKLEEEDDMLDLAMGLTTTSRLSCQLLICDDMEGAEIVIPEED